MGDTHTKSTAERALGSFQDSTPGQKSLLTNAQFTSPQLAQDTSPSRPNPPNTLWQCVGLGLVAASELGDFTVCFSLRQTEGYLS